ncbi:MAG: tetratricopeptide repeat protein [Candidatus Marinimicrobia bacterium]|nr:tetratricopeptide repeat protein [Candidatus Neomarinimicrobiota bacterium]
MSKSKRKLAAIVFTDIAGFTAISADDDEKALELILKQRELLQPIVERFNGKWLKEMGDGLLLSFSSSKKAVRCALKIQQITRDVEDLNLRIGIHQGDILKRDGDIFGDDVNIAARIEPFAAIGGIAISNKVNSDISGSPEITTKLISKSRLKGVSQNIRIYCITSHDLPQTVLSRVKAKLEPQPIWIRLGKPLSLMIITFSIYFIIFERDVPSIGILHMENLGGEEDDFWARGITEDVIIEVASAGLIRVAPMQEITRYIKSTLALANIAQKLQVKYLLTSSIHRHDGSFELRVQLINAQSGESIFANKWSDSLDQASRITGVLAEDILDELGIDTKRQITKHYPIDPEAYELYLRGKYQWEKRENQQDMEIALGLLKQSIELEPNLLQARLQLGKSYFDYRKHDLAMEILNESLKQSKKLDDKLVQASSLMNIGNIFFDTGDYEKARDYYEQALKIALVIGDRFHEASILLNIGNLHFYLGNLEIALSYYEKALATNMELKNLRGQGDAYLNIGSVKKDLFDYEEALVAYDKSYNIFHEIEEKSKELYPLIGTGLIAIEMGDFSLALKHLEVALEIARNIRDVDNEVCAMLYIADIYHQQGQINLALEYCQLALPISESIGDSYNSHLAHQIMGEIMLGMNEYEKAIFHFKAACNTWNEQDDPSYYLESLSYCALAESKSGKLDSLSLIIDKIEILIKETELSQESVIQLNWNLYQIFSEINDVNKAYSYLEGAFTAINNLAARFIDPEQKEKFIASNRINREIRRAYEQHAQKN